MFNWFKRKPNTVETVQQAKARLLNYLEHGDHSELVNVFRESIIEHEFSAQYLMVEIHIGVVIQKLKHKLTWMDIVVCDVNFIQDNSLNTLFIKEKYIVNEASAMLIIIKMLMIHIGYKSVSNMHLPHTLGRFISESSEV